MKESLERKPAQLRISLAADARRKSLASHDDWALVQRARADLIDKSPSQIARHHVMSAVHASPRVVAQRKLLDGIFGGATQSRQRNHQGEWQQAHGEPHRLPAQRATTEVGKPVQRMTENPDQLSANAGALTVPGKGAINYQEEDKKQAGKITKIQIKKQPATFKGENKEKHEPHLRHWWVLFEVQSNDWMQVDLNLNDGYRIIWGMKQPDPQRYRVREVSVREGLIVDDVVQAVTGTAQAKTKYYNPKVPDQKERYSCQDFVKQLIESLR